MDSFARRGSTKQNRNDNWKSENLGENRIYILWPEHQEGVKLDYDGSKVSYKCD